MISYLHVYIILLERVNVENKTVILFMRCVDVFAFFIRIEKLLLHNVISVPIQCIKETIVYDLT